MRSYFFFNFLKVKEEASCIPISPKGDFFDSISLHVDVKCQRQHILYDGEWGRDGWHKTEQFIYSAMASTSAAIKKQHKVKLSFVM